jgi:hypothetical protein
MATNRVVINEALRRFRALAPGDDPTVDELAAGLEALQSLMLELHEAAGPMTNVDVTADYIPGENERVRVQEGHTVAITYPNSILLGANAPDDYGFGDASQATKGSEAAADGVSSRPPRDGARIEVVGAAQELRFYRADINSWVLAGNLTADGELPLNARYRGAVAAMLAFRLCETWPSPQEVLPSAALARDADRGRYALMMRSGVARQPVRAEYF